MTPITCLVSTYNEADRLPQFLCHAKQWADEILIIDKSSTDDTRRIATDAGARVVQRPFSRQGHEDMVANVADASNDWVFVMTPGETPTPEFIELMKETLDRCGEYADIITVPKKLYSFGIHDPASPWSIGQQPMIVHRKRAVIRNRVHRNFSLSECGKCIHIQYSPTCYVLHPTHPDVRAFLASHVDYIFAERNGASDPDALIKEALHHLNSQTFGGHKPELFGQECAWKLYWLGCCLAAWEAKQGRDVRAEYQWLTDQALQQWN